jgi:nucleoprotein TPR
LLEDDLTNARAADSRAQTAQIAAQLDLRRQAQYARDSHDKYERELLAHAEDVKRLTETKQELKLVRARTSELSTKAEVAQANLVGSEASWGRQKTALGQEITDLKKR